MLQVGQEIEVRPGIVSKDQEGKLTCRPIFSRIVSLFAEQNDLQYAVPGGLIGVTNLFILSGKYNFTNYSYKFLLSESMSIFLLFLTLRHCYFISHIRM